MVTVVAIFMVSVKWNKPVLYDSIQRHLEYVSGKGKHSGLSVQANLQNRINGCLI